MLPILIQSPDFIVYSYPLLMGIGWGVAYQIFLHYFPQDKTRLGQLLFWGIFICSWLGAKSLYLLTSSSEYADQLSFWTGGGFVFYGGFLGAIAFLILIRTFRKDLSSDELWPMLPALLFGHSIGRLGCFLAGCCYGDLTNLWWGVDLHGGHRHPTQLIEALITAGLGLMVIQYKNHKWLSFSIYFLGYGIFRLGIEVLRGDLIRGLWGPLTPSQWISVALILVGTLLLSVKTRSWLSRAF